MSTHDQLRAAPVGAYGLWQASLGGQQVSGGFSEQQALYNARRVLEAGAGTALPVVEQQDQGRGITIHRERLPQLRHRLPAVAALAETVRQRFVSAWIQHLAESRYPYAAECRVAANLARILAVDDAIAWLHERHGPTCQPRCPLTDPWFEEPAAALVIPDCCGVPTCREDTEYVGRPGRGMTFCYWCAATEREEAERARERREGQEEHANGRP